MSDLNEYSYIWEKDKEKYVLLDDEISKSILFLDDNKIMFYLIEDDEEEESYHTEEMRNMYGGVFSREFILFFGENLQYYITEESSGHEALTFSDSVSISDVVSAGRESRYDLLNDMVVSKTLQDEDTLIQLMEEYVIDECFTDKVFTCI